MSDDIILTVDYHDEILRALAAALGPLARAPARDAAQVRVAGRAMRCLHEPRGWVDLGEVLRPSVRVGIVKVSTTCHGETTDRE